MLCTPPGGVDIVLKLDVVLQYGLAIVVKDNKVKVQMGNMLVADQAQKELHQDGGPEEKNVDCSANRGAVMECGSRGLPGMIPGWPLDNEMAVEGLATCREDPGVQLQGARRCSGRV